jgi:hypothetical protein
MARPLVSVQYDVVLAVVHFVADVVGLLCELRVGVSMLPPTLLVVYFSLCLS